MEEIVEANEIVVGERIAGLGTGSIDAGIGTSRVTTPEATSRSMVRASAALTTVTLQLGQWKAYEPEPSWPLTRTWTSSLVNSTSPQSGQLARIVAMYTLPLPVVSRSHRHGHKGP